MQVPVVSVDDVLDVMKDGTRNRFTAATKANKTSSRSHSIFIGAACWRVAVVACAAHSWSVPRPQSVCPSVTTGKGTHKILSCASCSVSCVACPTSHRTLVVLGTLWTWLGARKLPKLEQAVPGLTKLARSTAHSSPSVVSSRHSQIAGVSMCRIGTAC